MSLYHGAHDTLKSTFWKKGFNLLKLIHDYQNTLPARQTLREVEKFG